MGDWFDDALARYKRLAVTGAPRAGKTTLCERVVDRLVIHTDDHIELGWSEASAHVAQLVNAEFGKLIVEGVAVPRALRKGMQVDALIWLDWTLQPLTRGQASMAQGVRKVYQEWHAANPQVPVIIPPRGPARDALPKQEWPLVAAETVKA